MKYRKKPVVIEATKWLRNGDHPEDHDPIGLKNPTSMDLQKYHDYKETEGKVVRYYRHPSHSGSKTCTHCQRSLHVHGFIDTLEGGHIVCVGDYIITGVQGERYPCKPDIFGLTYERA
jgi:hypothetical protein